MIETPDLKHCIKSHEAPLNDKWLEQSDVEIVINAYLTMKERKGPKRNCFKQQLNSSPSVG